MYSTYDGNDEVAPTDAKKILILGGGPNRIGQGIEFDYCCCHAAFALKDAGYETIVKIFTFKAAVMNSQSITASEWGLEQVTSDELAMSEWYQRTMREDYTTHNTRWQGGKGLVNARTEHRMCQFCIKLINEVVVGRTEPQSVHARLCSGSTSEAQRVRSKTCKEKLKPGPDACRQ